jgi:hypothetical protein
MLLVFTEECYFKNIYIISIYQPIGLKKIPYYSFYLLKYSFILPLLPTSSFKLGRRYPLLQKEMLKRNKRGVTVNDEHLNFRNSQQR